MNRMYIKERYTVAKEQYQQSQASLGAQSLGAHHSQPSLGRSFLSPPPHSDTVFSMSPAPKRFEVLQRLRPPSDSVYLPVELPHPSSRPLFRSGFSTFLAAVLVTSIRRAYKCMYSNYIYIIRAHLVSMGSTGHEHQKGTCIHVLEHKHSNTYTYTLKYAYHTNAHMYIATC